MVLKVQTRNFFMQHLAREYIIDKASHRPHNFSRGWRTLLDDKIPLR